MEEKTVYAIYVDIMKLHKQYIGLKRNSEHLSGMVSDINKINSTFNSNFCNSMTNILREWFIAGFYGVQVKGVTAFYTDLWRLHKKYLNCTKDAGLWESFTEDTAVLDKKYPFQQLRKYVLAIAEEIETAEMDFK